MSTHQPTQPRHAIIVARRSAWVAAGAAIAGLAAVAMSTGTGASTALGLVIGVLLAVSIAAIDEPGAIRTTLAGVGLVGGIAGALGLPVALLTIGNTGGAGMAAAGVLLGVGIARFRVPAIGDGAVGTAIGWLLRVGFMIGVLALLVAAVRLDFDALAAVITTLEPVAALLTPASGPAGAFGFIVAAWLAFAGVWLGVSSLPPAAVLPESNRSTYRRWRTRIVWWAGVLFGGASTALALLYLLGTEAGAVGELIVRIIGPVIEFDLLRTVLVQLFLVGVVLTVLMAALRSVGAAIVFKRPGWVPSVVTIGLAVLVGAVIGGELVLTYVVGLDLVPETTVGTVTDIVGPTAVVTLLAMIAIAASVGILAVLPALGGIGLLPPATAGPRLTVAGVVLAVIAGATAGAPAIALLIGIVGAIVAWDTAEYGVGLVVDLGRTPASREGEFVHAAASLLVAGVAILITLLAFVLISGIDPADHAVELVALLGTLAAVVVALVVRH